jgi:hypothetical protein
MYLIGDGDAVEETDVPMQHTYVVELESLVHPEGAGSQVDDGGGWVTRLAVVPSTMQG